MIDDCLTAVKITAALLTVSARSECRRCLGCLVTGLGTHTRAYLFGATAAGLMGD